MNFHEKLQQKIKQTLKEMEEAGGDMELRKEQNMKRLRKEAKRLKHIPIVGGSYEKRNDNLPQGAEHLGLNI